MARQTSALTIRGDLSIADLKKQAKSLQKKYGHLAQEDAHAAEGASEGVPTISSDNLSFALRGGEVIGFPRQNRAPGQELPMIVLAHAFYNALMPERYVKGQPPRIDCAAVSETLENMGPPEAWPKEKRGAEKCQLCPNNAFGSGDEGKGKACRNSDALIVLPLHNVDPASFNMKWIEKQPLVRMFVPPTSMKHWGKYASMIVDAKKGAGVPLHAVVTLATVQPSDKSKQEVVFTAASFPPENVMAALTARRAEARELAVRPPVYQAPKAADAKSKGTAGRKRVAPKR